jgi:hypothetical protein
MIPLAAPLISRELGAHMTRRQCPHFTITSLQDYDILLGFINESSHLPFKNKKGALTPVLRLRDHAIAISNCPFYQTKRIKHFF